MPMERLGLLRFQEMLRQSRNAEEALLALHFACARLTREVVEIEWPSPTAFGEWLKRLQGQREGPGNTLAQRSLAYLALNGSRIDMVDLYEARLEGANLSGAQMRYATLLRAVLVETNLSGAFLIEAVLKEANLRGANLTDANLLGADLFWADLERANLKDVNLTNAQMPDDWDPDIPTTTEPSPDSADLGDDT
jgi:uncharacterized protein YjbI with pentapeptide repeats